VRVQGLRNLMSKLGARPGGKSHVVITDLREELVVYVNGKPYLRRELEMPSAALHHAGKLDPPPPGPDLTPPPLYTYLRWELGEL